MANSQSADLMGIGAHCSAPGCGQVDFLPFKCNYCQLYFCLDHRSYAAHSCKHARSQQTNAIVCPICSKGVRVQHGQDVNMIFDEHFRTDCDPERFIRKRPRCPVRGCRERLSLVNTYTCKQCNQKVCLAHRHESDHSCPGPQTSKQNNAFSAISSRMFTGIAQQGQPQPCMEHFERCPECGKAFEDAVELVQHVQTHRYQRRQALRTDTQSKASACTIS